VTASEFCAYFSPRAAGMSAEEEYVDFDSLIEDAEQYTDQENADLIREYENHVREFELSFSSLVSWFYNFSDLEVGDENKANIGLLANRHV